MLIRPAAAADVVAVAGLVKRYWEFEGIANFQSARIEALLHELLASPRRGACWVVEDGGGIAAYLLLAYVFSLEHGGLMAEIDEVFVTSPLRAAGVGSLLLEAVERHLAAFGVNRIQLQLGVENLRARRFYARHGFALRAGYDLFDKGI